MKYGRVILPCFHFLRVCVETLLPGKQLIQMDCLLHHSTGLIPEGASEYKHCLHVQSLSHWAPANIGPYSQAVKVKRSWGFVGADLDLMNEYHINIVHCIPWP